MRSWSITARLAREVGQDGVLTAMGDIHSGYTLFIQDDRAHFVSNLFGEMTELSSPDALPAEASEIEVEFVHDGTLWAIPQGGLWDRFRFFGGDVVLKVDRVAVARGRLLKGPPVLMWEGLDVGLDRGSPVTRAYEAPFAFAGDLEEVVFDLR